MAHNILILDRYNIIMLNMVVVSVIWHVLCRFYQRGKMKLKISDNVTVHVSKTVILTLLIDQLVFFLFVLHFYMSRACSSRVDALL